MLKFKIITPERVVYEDEVDAAIIPTAEGEITVLPHHIPLVGLLQAGVLRLKKGSEETPLAVSTGVIEVSGNSIVILAESADRADELDEDKIARARDEAKKIMEQERVSEEEYAEAQAALARELARAKVARMRTGRSHKGPSPTSAE